jgi:hypothetical protein
MSDTSSGGAMGPLLAEALATVDAGEGDDDPFERARQLADHRSELLADRRRELAADLRDGDAGDRRRAGRWLCALADAVPSAVAPAEGAVVDALGDPAVHPWCHGVLTRLGDEPVAGERPREQALQADDPELRRLAAHSCGRRESRLSETEVDLLVELVTDHGEAVETRSHAARGLYRRGRYGDVYRPRPAAVVPALLELADGSHPVGRRVAPALLVRVALGAPDGHDDRTVTAVADAVDAALRDEDHRVRLRAAAALASEPPGDGDRTAAAVERFGPALATATDDDHPVVAERAEQAHDRLSYRVDLPERPSNRSTADPDADLAEQVGVLADGDPAELAANAALLVRALEGREAEAEATAALATLADREPARLVEVDAVTALVEAVEDGRHGSRDAARALVGVVREHPEAVPERGVEAAIARLAATPGHEPEGTLWLPLTIALDGTASLSALLDRAELDAVAAVGALEDGDPRLAGTLGTVLRERLRGLDPTAEAAGEAARGLARLATVAPDTLDGDPGPAAAVRALDGLDAEGCEAALADLRAVAADRPEAVAPAAEALLGLALAPERAVREAAAETVARVGRSQAGVEALSAGEARRDAVAALAAVPAEPDRRPPSWPAGVLARADPERVRTAVVEHVETSLAGRGRREDGEALAELLREVHAGDPSVARPALEPLLASLAPESSLPDAEPTGRPDALAALAGIANRYPGVVVERVEELAGVALSGGSSSQRPTGNAATVLGALIDESHEDAVYAAIREELTLDPRPERHGNDRGGYIRRHRKLASEHERVGELYVQALLHETGVALQRYRDAVHHAVTAFDVDVEKLAGADDGSVGLFAEGLAATDFRAAARAVDGPLPSGEVASIVELLAGVDDERASEAAAAADRLAELAARRPEAVAGRIDDLVAMLDDYRGLTRLIGTRVLDVLAGEAPAATVAAVVPLAERLVDDREAAVVHHAASALTAIAAEDPAVVRAAIEDRLDDSRVDADTPAEALRGEEATRAAVRPVLESVGIDLPDESGAVADGRADADSPVEGAEEGDPDPDDGGTAEESETPVSPGEGIQFARAALEGLDGRTVVLTGAFALGTREELRALLERSGARVTGSVSGRTDLLFVGTDPGRRKREDAAEHGVPALSERDLYRLLGLEPVEVADLVERPDGRAGEENGGEDGG